MTKERCGYDGPDMSVNHPCRNPAIKNGRCWQHQPDSAETPSKKLSPAFLVTLLDEEVGDPSWNTVLMVMGAMAIGVFLGHGLVDVKLLMNNLHTIGIGSLFFRERAKRKQNEFMKQALSVVTISALMGWVTVWWAHMELPLGALLRMIFGA